MQTKHTRAKINICGMTHVKCSQIQIPYFLILGLNSSQISLLLQAAILYFLGMGEDGERRAEFYFVDLLQNERKKKEC